MKNDPYYVIVKLESLENTFFIFHFLFSDSKTNKLGMR